MTEIEINPDIKKIAKKGNMSAEEALIVIQTYDAGIKAFKDASRISHQAKVHAAEIKLAKIKARNANKSLVGGCGIFGLTALGILASAFAGNTDPAILLALIPGVVPALGGAYAVDMMNANNDSRFHRIFSPHAYTKLKTEIEMEKQLESMKVAEFQRLEEKMLKKTAKAMEVINDALSDQGEMMSYSSLISGGNGFVLTKKPVEELDQWGKLRQKIVEQSKAQNSVFQDA